MTATARQLVVLVLVLAGCGSQAAQPSAARSQAVSPAAIPAAQRSD